MTAPSTPQDDPATFQDAHLREHLLHSQVLFQGKFLNAYRDEVRLPDGSVSNREYVKHPGAVVIAAQLPDGRYVMERQFRYPVQRVMVEFPAGKLEQGEAPLRCAQRELLEETGYQAQQWAHAGLMHPCIGYSNEFIDIWFAKDLQLGARHLDEGEFLDVFSASLPEMLDWTRQGMLTDAKSMSVLLWLQNLHLGAWSLDWHKTEPISDN